MKTFDLAIVGGGLVGLTLAQALAHRPRQIALMDAMPLQATDDTRYIALNDASVCLFKNIGIWPALAKHATPIKQVHVSHRKHFGKVTLTADELNLAAMGQVVPAHLIQSELYAAIQRAPNIQLFRPAVLQHMQKDTTHVTLQLSLSEGPVTLSAAWVVAADGSRSSIRQWLNIPLKQIDYHQSALVTRTQLKRSHQQIAYERFLKKGAIAMLPLPDNQAATIWTDTHEAIEALLHMPETDFLASLQEQMGYRLGRLCGIGKRSAFPLQKTEVAQYKKDRVILMGNAAHTQHPIAAQGLNLSLYEVAVFAENFLKDPPVFDSVGSASRQQFFSQQLSHQLQGLFSQDFFMVNWARQFSMLGLDSCLPAKNSFARAAMGRTGPQPRWMIRGQKD